MKKILGLLATGCLALAANTASAIPIQINVLTGGLAAGGDWDLSGPTNASGSWGGVIFGFQSWDLDVEAGDYLWEIGGGGLFASVSWSLNLDGSTIFTGSDGSFGFFRVNADHSFTANPGSETISVPEPGTLGLLGLGLWVIGFAATRRRLGRSSDLQV
ncbi:MAG: PEP-CTERM sorting domain-containing protein [Woeseia sp.]